MRKSLTVGILSETKNRWEKRSPLTPRDVAWLVKRGISVEVCSSPLRIFPDAVYEKSGARVVHRFQKADLLVGVKEPPVGSLQPGKVYCVFSHTAKGQKQNRALLREALKKEVTLMDYEYMRDKKGNRAVYFGRFAGICGMLDSLHYLGERYRIQGIKTPLEKVKRALDYGTLAQARRHLALVRKEIKERGFPPSLSPFVIGITGHGNVSSGAQEILELLSSEEIHPKDMAGFIRRKKRIGTKIYKIVFTREEKLRSKDGGGFYFEQYLRHPERFESNLDQYLPFIPLLIHGSYWDERYPRLVTEKMIRKIVNRQENRMAFIGDLTCDVRGSIEITQKATDPDHPVFMYEPRTGTIHDGLLGRGIGVMAVDNLPAEFPEDASVEFGEMIRDYIYQIAVHGATDLASHHALPIEIRNAVICQQGCLRSPFKPLKQFVL